jgi:hypothetical protein
VLIAPTPVETIAATPIEYEKAVAPPIAIETTSSGVGGQATARPNRSVKTLLAILAGVTILGVVGVVAGMMLRENDALDPSPSATPSPQVATAQPSVAPVVVSEECDNSFLFAATHRGEPGAQEFLARTTQLCSTAAEWVAGLTHHPAAASLADPARASIATLQSLCSTQPTLQANAACVDAAARATP